LSPENLFTFDGFPAKAFGNDKCYKK